MSSEPLPKWKTRSPETLLWEQWDEEYAAFHATSGKTHFLNTSSALILQFLSRQEADAGRVAAEIGDRTGAPVDEVLEQQILNALLHFEQLGLVARILGPRSAAS